MRTDPFDMAARPVCERHAFRTLGRCDLTSSRMRRQEEHKAHQFGLASCSGFAEDPLEMVPAGLEGDTEAIGGFANVEPIKQLAGDASFGGGEPVELLHERGAWPRQ